MDPPVKIVQSDMIPSLATLHTPPLLIVVLFAVPHTPMPPPLWTILSFAMPPELTLRSPSELIVLPVAVPPLNT